MKRDWDQIRRILIKLEESVGEIRASDFDDPEEVVDYHMNLLIEAGLVEGRCVVTRSQVRSCRIERMSWNGHELLDTMRNQSMWNRIKESAMDKGISLSFEVIMSLAKNLIY